MGAFVVSRDEADPGEIRFALAAPSVQIPEDQQSLQQEIQRANMTLRMICPQGGDRFEEYFRSLLSLAQVGLVFAQVDLAKRALTQWKEEVVAREGGRIKNNYMKRLGVRAAWLGAPTLVVGVLVQVLFSSYAVFGNFLLLWTGCMAGVWLSFGARKLVLRFEELHVPEEDLLEPLVRLAFAGLLAVVVGLLFSVRTVTISLGAVESWQFRENAELAVLIGVLSGLGEKALSTRVAAKATELLRFRS